MQALRLSKKRPLSLSLFSSVARATSSHRTLTILAPCYSRSLSLSDGQATAITISKILARPWSVIQHRGARVNASHVRPGNVIEKSGRIYQVLETEHKQRGRGGAILTLELRDVDNGSKQSMRFGTEEGVERVFVEEKSLTCLYVERGTAYLMDLENFEQLEVPMSVFGRAGSYLKDQMKVKLQTYDGRPLSGSVPKQVTCSIKETQVSMKGTTITPRYKRALLDNDLTIQVPGYLEPGEEIVVNTEDDSFVSRSNK